MGDGNKSNATAERRQDVGRQAFERVLLFGEICVERRRLLDQALDRLPEGALLFGKLSAADEDERLPCRFHLQRSPCRHRASVSERVRHATTEGARVLSFASMTDDEYWQVFEAIRADVEAAIKSHHTHITIRKLGAEPDINRRLNKFPGFWIVNSFALQTTMFTALGRIFDTRSDSHSVQKLIEATIENPSLFSKVALRGRKRLISRIQDDDPQ